MKYYEKILASKPLAADYLNAGHVAWRTGKIEKAAELYSKAALEYDIPLMMDLVKNSNNSLYSLCTGSPIIL